MTQPIPPLTRLVGALLQRSPSIATMSLEQIERSQATTLLRNVLTTLLLGGLQKGVAVEERTISGPAGSLRLRIYTPRRATATPRPLIVYFHGGGWVLGTIQMGDWLCSTVARDTDAVVVSVDYRLAPRHSFPSGVDDCYAALVWCSQHAAALGADASRIGVMGESAGGNLAAVTCLMACSQGGPAIRHQALLYPVIDGSRSTPSYEVNKDAIILTAADMHAFYQHYLAAGVDPLDWHVSPLYAPNHGGLPPAIIVVAGHDPLHDEGVLYAEKLRASSVQVTLKEYPAMPHGFANFPHLARDAKPAMGAVTQVQRDVLQG